ncbi:MAG: YceI family protein [Bacteroidetes bacterium]|nr:MAG: YceI family protein [Bacteroidota bacterium]
MKSIFNLSVLSILLFFFACNNAPAGEEAPAGEAQSTTTAKPTAGSEAFTVDPDASNVAWKATKLMGGGHNGAINISAGTVHVENGEVVAGSFTIDMNSIVDLDLEDLSMKSDLESHLKSGDFFDVANHPTATFEITEAVPSSENSNGRQSITGNLTIKGITKSISFYAKVAGSETGVSASTGSFVIDRTEWDVMFNSGALGTAKDKIINDKVALDITIVASRN